METIRFPKDFLFGTATSAAQLEGAAREEGKGLSIWDTFARIPGNIADGSTPENACDLYHRYEEDLDLAQRMNLNSFRFSFSWPRILPEGKGKVNQKGLDYYKRFIDGLWKRNMIPNATIYHWDLPYELERLGGWLNRDVADWFGEYASLLYREFGDAVPMWATVNEPIATYVGYALGGFAPGFRLEKYGRQANHHILLAHGEAIRRFRQENLKESKAGIVVDIWQHYPLRPDNDRDCEIARLENEKTFRSYLNPVLKGCYRQELLQYMEEKDCMPVIKDGDMERIRQPLDFFGLNCYNRVLDCAKPCRIGRKTAGISWKTERSIIRELFMKPWKCSGRSISLPFPFILRRTAPATAGNRCRTGEGYGIRSGSNISGETCTGLPGPWRRARISGDIMSGRCWITGNGVPALKAALAWYMWISTRRSVW